MTDGVMKKALLLTEGVHVSDDALEGVGSRYKEQVHHLFEYDFEAGDVRPQPADLRMADGTVVQVRLNPRSPLRVDRTVDGLVVSGDELAPTPIEWLPRPDFYDRKTSDGTPMTRVAELVGECCLAICHTNFCLTFKNGKQCHFCNLNTTATLYTDTIIRKKAQQVGEVVAAAFEEGAAKHIEITGGILPDDVEIGVLEAYLSAIREATGLESIPGCAIMTPPRDLNDLNRLHALGLEAVGFNLECTHPDFFRAYCPGKEERIGYERYREALRAAVEIWGPGGRVFSGLVVGLEPMDYTIAGIEELAQEGVASIPMVWSPSTGTRLNGHRPPHASWYVDLARRAAWAQLRHLRRDPAALRFEPVRCRGCQSQVLTRDVFAPGLGTMGDLQSRTADRLAGDGPGQTAAP